MKSFLSIVLLILSSLVCVNARNIDAHNPNQQELVIAQMNYCINSLTNIIENNSIEVLDHELDQLLNNLTMKELVGLDEVARFRISLLQNINSLQITNEERELLKRIQFKNRKLKKWDAISNALNGVLFILPGNSGSVSTKAVAIQTASLALFTAARTAIEYKRTGIQSDIEEMRQMWELRKSDLNTFTAQRKSALELVISLFQKYNLDEKDRLTEESCKRFNEIITTNDPHTRIRRLNDEKNSYSKMMDFYYHLGMAYIDVNDYKTAKPLFLKYLQMYKNAPIFRYDEKSGCIALAMLSFDKELSDSKREELIKSALENLPNNGAALVQCAIHRMAQQNRINDAYNLLRMGIDRTSISDKDLIIDTTITLLENIKKYPSVYKDICTAIEGCNDISLTSYVSYLISSNQLTRLSELFIFLDRKPEENFSLKKYLNQFTKLNHYMQMVPLIGKYFFWDEIYESIYESIRSADDLYIYISNKYRYELSDFEIYQENQDKNTMKIIKNIHTDIDAFTHEDIMNELDFLENYEELFWSLFTKIGPDNYKVKPTINISKIKNNDFSSFHPRINNLFEYKKIPSGDIEDLVDFLEEHRAKQTDCSVLRSQDKTGWFTTSEYYLPYMECYFDKNQEIQIFDKSIMNKKTTYLPSCRIDFYGDKLTYKPMPFYNNQAKLFKIKFNGVLEPVLTFSISKDAVDLYAVEVADKVFFSKPQKIQMSSFLDEHAKLVAEKNDTIGIIDKAKNQLNKLINKEESKQKNGTTKEQKEDKWYKFW